METINIENLPTQKQSNCLTCIHYDKINYGCIRPKTLPQCEYTRKDITIEEAASKWCEENQLAGRYNAFIAGSNWQKDQTEQLQKEQIQHTAYLESQLLKISEKLNKMYTEEEVKILFYKAQKANCYDNVLWFEQNKKK